MRQALARSSASVEAWGAVFRVRHRRTPRQEDRDESRVLRDEAHSQLILRHALWLGGGCVRGPVCV